MPIPRLPVPMIVRGRITDQNQKPLSGVIVNVRNSVKELLKNPSTSSPLKSTTKADGKYAIIYGFNGIQAGRELNVNAPGQPEHTFKINPASNGIQNIVIPSAVVPSPKGNTLVPSKESWLKKNKWWVIGGGATLAGVVVLIIVLTRRRK